MIQRIISKLFCFAIILLILFTSSCEETTKPETVTFSGTVTLEGETDYSGVKVSLYKPVELDTALLRINQQYPNIGVQISQETEFDHREHTPIYSTTTNASGAWKIEDVTPGTYNFVAVKNSFGWRYLYEISSTTTNSILLKKTISLSGNISQSMTFSNGFIEINGNTIFPSSTMIEFQGVNFIKFNNNYDVVIKGNCTINTAAKLLVISDSANIVGEINFEDFTNLKLHDILVLNSTRFNVINSTVEINNSIFKNSKSIAIENDNTNTLVNNVLFFNSQVGLGTNATSNFNCQKCIFINNSLDIELFSVSNTVIANNYFIYSDQNLDLVQIDGYISNNQFEMSGLNIDISSISNINFQYNNFINDINNINLTRISHVFFPISMTVNNNNFINTDSWIIYQEGYTVKDSVNAINNYWDTSSELVIEDKIYDRSDYSVDDRMRFIVYKPFSYTKIDSTGIINN